MSLIERFEAKIYYGLDGCWYWIGALDTRGYGQFAINRKSKRAHRVSYLFYKSIHPREKSVCHTCDNPACVNPNHLFLGSHDENMKDMVKKGRSKVISDTHKGVKNVNAILTPETVRCIRKEYPGLTHKKLGEKYGVHKETIAHLLRGNTWKHIV